MQLINIIMFRMSNKEIGIIMLLDDGNILLWQKI
jgi:hypothetical protein